MHSHAVASAIRPQQVSYRSTRRPRLARYIYLALVIAGVVFAVRGVYRGARTHITNDYFSIYTISKAWLAGNEPYSTQVFVATFQKASGYQLGRNTLPLAATYTALPGMVPITAPFSLFRWQIANAFWVIFGAGTFVLMLWMFSRSASAPQSRVLIFFISCLLLGPIHTGLSGANVTPLLVGLMGISYLLYRRQHRIFAGFLLGIVGCCKPHIAGAMVLVLLAERAWVTLGAAVATGLTSLAVFLGRLAVNGVPWWNGFLQRTLQFGRPGDANDFSLANPARYELTNLQVILGSITSSRTAANLVAISITVLLVALWWIGVKRQGTVSLLAFAGINVVLLLPSYHRFDDASVLVFLFAAAWLEEVSPPWLRKTALIAITMFAMPLPAALVQAVERGFLPAGLLASKLFQLTCLTVQIWLLLFLSVLLVSKLLEAAAAVKSRHAAARTSFDLQAPEIA